MSHVGLDLSRRRLDAHVLDEAGQTVGITTAPPDRDGLAHLVREVDLLGWGQVLAAIESMNGARFVHDTLELVVDPQIARKMGEAGRRQVIQSFSWPEAARLIVELYRVLDG